MKEGGERRKRDNEGKVDRRKKGERRKERRADGYEGGGTEIADVGEAARFWWGSTDRGGAGRAEGPAPDREAGEGEEGA